MRIHRIIAFISIIFIITSPISHVNAGLQVPDTVDIPLIDLHDGDAIKLDGIAGSRSLVIPIPTNWSIAGDNWLDLFLVANIYLDLQRSSMTLQLNDQTIASFSLYGNVNTWKKVLIPSSMFSQGKNSLVLTGAFFLETDQATTCTNWEDPARQVLVNSGSKLHLSFVKRDPPVDLSIFPDFFDNPLKKYLPTGRSDKTLFVLPDDATQDDLSSLSATAYALGFGSVSDVDWNPSIIKESQFTPGIAGESNVVLISAFPPTVDLAQIHHNSNGISIVPSPWSKGFVVITIYDMDRNDGFAPAIALADPSKRDLLHGEFAAIDPYLPTTSPVLQGVTTFDQLGYLDRTVDGIDHQEITYRIYIPANNEAIRPDLTVIISHSPNLDPDRSDIKLYVNGKTAAKIRPTARTEEPISIPVAISPDQLHPGVNYLRFTFDLRTQETTCRYDSESIWATIWKESQIDVSYHHQMLIASLSSYSIPFGDDPGVSFVLPNDANLIDIAHIARFSFLLGNTSSRGNQPPDVKFANQFDPVKAVRPNFFLVGLVNQNRVLAELNPSLPQPFNKSGLGLAAGFITSLPAENLARSVGILEVVSNPWNKDGLILAVSGTDEQGLSSVWEKIEDPAIRTQFSGNIMVVQPFTNSSTQNITQNQESTVHFLQTADLARIPLIGQILQRGDWISMLLLFVAVILAVILVLISLFVKENWYRAHFGFIGKGEQNDQENTD